MERSGADAVAPESSSFDRDGALALLRQGRDDLAEPLLEIGRTLLPTDVELAVEYARLAQRRGNLSEAITRWRYVQTHFPDEIAGYDECLTCLMAANLPEEIEALCDEAHKRFPHIDRFTVEFAWRAHHRRDWNAALERWRRVHERFPNHLTGYLGQAYSLTLAGRIDDADALLGAGVKNDPGHRELAVAYARLAQEHGDLTVALQRWESVREGWPDDPVSYSGGAYCLSRMKRGADADALLEAAIKRFPLEHRVYWDYARTAQQRGDNEEAVQRWAIVRCQFPQDTDAYAEPGRILTDAGRLDEADDLLALAIEQFPRNHRLCTEFARSARNHGDRTEVVRRWAIVRERFPEDPNAYIEPGRILGDLGLMDDADELMREGRSTLPNNFAIAATWADIPGRRQAWREAERRWVQVRLDFPGEADGYLQAAKVQVSAKREAEADALLTTALQHFPNHPGLVNAWAYLSMQRQDWPTAVDRWAEMRRRFPQDASGYTDGARALAELLRFDESDTLLDQAMILFPDSVHVMFHWAHLAPRSKKPEEVLERWRRFRERFPNHTAGYIFGAWYLQEIGRDAEAEVMSDEARQRFPGDLEVERTWAGAALRKGDLAGAAERFQQAAERYPADLQLVKGLLSALVLMKDNVRIQRALDQARIRWPRDFDILRRSIEYAKSVGNTDEAFSIWASLEHDADIDPNITLDLAWYLYNEHLPKEPAGRLLIYLGNERDTAAPDWLPRVSGFIHLLGRGTDLVDFARDFVSKQPREAFQHGPLAVMKRDLEIDISEAETFDLFDAFVNTSRTAMTAHLFSYYYWRRKPGRFEEIAEIFGKYMDLQRETPTWIRRGQESKILAWLIFAAVFNQAEYIRIIEAVRQTLEPSYDGTLTTPESVVASMVAGAAVPGGADAIAAPHIAAKRPLRIAMCVSGQVRGYQQAFPSWSQLGLEQHETTRFIHVWKDVGRHWRRVWSFTRDNPRLYVPLMDPDSDQFLRARYPRLANAVIAGDVAEQHLKDFYQTDFVRIEDDQAGGFVGQPNVRKMHYKIQKAFQFAMESGNEYDLVVRIRPDIQIRSKETVDWNEVYEEVRSKRLVFTDLPLRYVHDRLELGDQFCATTPEIMEIYSNVLSEVDEYTRNQSVPYGVMPQLASHVQLAMLTLYRGILSRDLPVLRGSALLDPAMLSVAEIYELLKTDLSERESDEFDNEFLVVCERDSR